MYQHKQSTFDSEHFWTKPYHNLTEASVFLFFKYLTFFLLCQNLMIGISKERAISRSMKSFVICWKIWNHLVVLCLQTSMDTSMKCPVVKAWKTVRLNEESQKRKHGRWMCVYLNTWPEDLDFSFTRFSWLSWLKLLVLITSTKEVMFSLPLVDPMKNTFNFGANPDKRTDLGMFFPLTWWRGNVSLGAVMHSPCKILVQIFLWPSHSTFFAICTYSVNGITFLFFTLCELQLPLSTSWLTDIDFTWPCLLWWPGQAAAGRALACRWVLPTPLKGRGQHDKWFINVLNSLTWIWLGLCVFLSRMHSKCLCQHCLCKSNRGE